MSSESTRADIPSRVGRYEIKKVLGRGSMGMVLLARDPEIDRTVAIKLIQVAVQLDKKALDKYRERFRREAKAAGKLMHPGIVMIFDVGTAEGEAPFIVMEYVQGRTLQEVLETGGLTLEESLRLAREILDALGYAHSQGVVHRDIKPANMIITSDGHIKIMDFGIAHLVGSEFTKADEILGSPYYMAPEQLSKKAIDQRTDLFAFGVVLYRMLTGKLAFAGDSFASIAHGILYEVPEPPDRINRAVSHALGKIVLRCLAKDPEKRYGSAGEAKEALTSLHAPEERPTAGRTSPGETGTERVQRGGRRLRWAVVLLLLIGIASALYFPLTGQEIPVPEAVTRALRSFFPLEPPSGGPPEPALEELSQDPVAEPTTPLEALAEEPEKDAEPEPPPPEEPSEAQLFYEATVAFENGRYQTSRARLRTLLERNPGFSGASELLVAAEDQLWARSLPITLQARHNHRIGSCTGTLTLARWGVGFRSEEHGWQWRFDAIRIMEREDRTTLTIETYEKDLLGLGKPKRYRFELLSSLGNGAWTRFQRLADQYR